MNAVELDDLESEDEAVRETADILGDSDTMAAIEEALSEDPKGPQTIYNVRVIAHPDYSPGAGSVVIFDRFTEERDWYMSSGAIVIEDAQVGFTKIIAAGLWGAVHINNTTVTSSDGPLSQTELRDLLNQANEKAQAEIDAALKSYTESEAEAAEALREAITRKPRRLFRRRR